MNNKPKENLDAGNKMRTYTGRYIDAFNMTIEDIDILDITHSLALTTRWNGHSQEPYSIAEHCVWMAERATTPETKMEALLHDASEAYIVDVPTPIKKRMPEYLVVEEHIMSLVAKKFGFSLPMSEEVKKLDRQALEFEWENKVLDNTFTSMEHHEAKRRFLECFYEIQKQISEAKKFDEING
jgi:5'-deoxynucleotidase YfbR-like HD superfamily hydrolase